MGKAAYHTNQSRTLAIERASAVAEPYEIPLAATSPPAPALKRSEIHRRLRELAKTVGRSSKDSDGRASESLDFLTHAPDGDLGGLKPQARKPMQEGPPSWWVTRGKWAAHGRGEGSLRGTRNT